ncbi:MAG: DUF1016 domain-containing protein [Desulfobacterales bacterium]|nr:DUF1016 domain-containing protein [Desulfobacterales bacterium]
MSKEITTTQNKLETQFNEVLVQIQRAKQQAHSQVNTVLIELYWNVGQYICDHVRKSNWGQGIVQELADYIVKQDAKLKSFSSGNLWRMKQFFETYRENEKLYTLCTQLSRSHNRRIWKISQRYKKWI